jgi:putative FmdB family regulatory protein
MPTYEYACRDCGEHLEVVQSFKDDPLTECGRCGGALRKVFSAAGIIFKGSGYYVTDSRSKSGKGGDGAESSGSAASSSDGSKSATSTSKSDTAKKSA